MCQQGSTDSYVTWSTILENYLCHIHYLPLILIWNLYFWKGSPPEMFSNPHNWDHRSRLKKQCGTATDQWTRSRETVPFPNRDMKICARKIGRVGWGHSHKGGGRFSFCMIFYSSKFINDKFRVDCFRTKRRIYLGEKQWHSVKGICCANLILILQSGPKLKETIT